MELAPVVLFTYNRPWHTRQTIDALLKNELTAQSDLFIYSDGPKDGQAKNSIKEVRNYINTIDGFKSVTIRERKQNCGLAKSIIGGVTEVITEYGRVIVLEDDLISSPIFLKYMNYYLNDYKNEQNIFSVTGFNYPERIFKIPYNYKYSIYFGYRCMSWSWATWLDRWEKVDWRVKDFGCFIRNNKSKKLFNQGGSDLSGMLRSQIEGNIDSWAIRWCYAHYKNNSYCVYPVKSLIINIGFDGTGVHCGNTNKFASQLIHGKYDFKNQPPTIEINNYLAEQNRNIYKANWKSLIIRVFRGIVKCIKM
jgi:hypothetical protein